MNTSNMDTRTFGTDPLPVLPSDYTLPSTLRDLQNIHIRAEGQVVAPWWMFWEFLRSFFKQHGYDLYKTSTSPYFVSIPITTEPASTDSFNLYGDRSDFERDFAQRSCVFAAVDRKNRDVVIRVVARGDEGARELEILQLLQTEPLKSDPRNATISILEFIHYEDWVFMVMPAQDDCDNIPFQTVDEILEFGEQLITALAFLHSNCIAHLDVAYENVLINHRGTVHDEKNFRSSFPVRYAVIDFGWSEFAPSRGPGSGYMRPPLKSGRITKAQESERGPFDPYAADVWQVSQVLYIYAFKCIDEVPGLLNLFQDMTRWRPASRPTMAQSLSRLRCIRAEIKSKHPEALSLELNHQYWETPRVPFRHWTVVFDALRCLEFKFVYQFILHFRKDLLSRALKTLSLWTIS